MSEKETKENYSLKQWITISLIFTISVLVDVYGIGLLLREFRGY